MHKTLLFSDLHGGIDVRDRITSRVKTFGGDYKNTLIGIKDTAVNLGVARIMNLGDSGVSKRCLDNGEVVDSIHDVLSDFELHKLLGNHCVGTFFGNRQSAKGLYQSDTPKHIDLGGMSGLLLDIMFGKESGRLPDDTLQWLQHEVDGLSRDTVAIGHYPISEDLKNTTYYHEYAPERAFLENSAAVREILQGSSRVKRYISGHTHKHHEVGIGGIVHTTIPSVSENRHGRIDGRVGIFDASRNELELVSTGI